MVKLVLAKVFAPPSIIETKNAAAFTCLMSLTFLSGCDWDGKRQFVALQSHVIPLVVFVKDRYSSTSLCKVSNDGKTQGGQLASHLMRAVASDNLDLQLHHVMDIRFDRGTPQAVRQATVNGIGKEC
jgi:hypothetical protein